jgi:hypothetical protein
MRRSREQNDAAAVEGDRRLTAIADVLVADHRVYFPGVRTTPRIVGMNVVRRRLSDVARVELDFGDTLGAVYVKIHKKAGRSPEHLRRKMATDFEALSLLDGALGRDAAHRVPAPVAIFPDQLAVVTRAAEGQPLHRLIRASAPVWKGAAHETRLVDACHRAGRWLGEFQSVTARSARAPFSADHMIQRVRADLDVCVGLGLSRAEAGRIDAFCSDRFGRFDGDPLPVCGVHPDFQPDNILVSPRAVTVLDFSDFHHGAPFGDVARFLASVDFFARNPLYRSARLRRLMTAFIAGYTDRPSEVGAPLGVWFVRFLVRSTAGVKSWSSGSGLRGLLARSLAVRFLSRWEERLEGMLRAVAAPTERLTALHHPSATPGSA